MFLYVFPFSRDLLLCLTPLPQPQFMINVHHGSCGQDAGPEFVSVASDQVFSNSLV